jgi:hypothetical protein
MSCTADLYRAFFFLFPVFRLIIPQQRETSEAYQLVTNSRSVPVPLFFLFYFSYLILWMARVLQNIPSPHR